MQRLLKKMGLPALLIGTGALLALTATALILAVGYHDQVRDLKAVVYTRCMQQSTATDATRTAQLRYYQGLLVNLREHPSPQAAAFNAQLTRDLGRVVAELQHALVIGDPRGCAVYR